jgi:hypothetical protein
MILHLTFVQLRRRDKKREQSLPGIQTVSDDKINQPGSRRGTGEPLPRFYRIGHELACSLQIDSTGQNEKSAENSSQNELS